MKQRFSSYLWIPLIAACWLAGCDNIVRGLRALGESLTVMSLSPDDKYRVSLWELNAPLMIDRNFRIKLTEFSPSPWGRDTTVQLFQSPDEGRPIGSERFIWSKDSQYVLLVGRHFFEQQVTGYRIPTGEIAYWLLHVPSRKVCCNSTLGGWTHFDANELREISFTEPVVEEAENSVPAHRPDRPPAEVGRDVNSSFWSSVFTWIRRSHGRPRSVWKSTKSTHTSWITRHG